MTGRDILVIMAIIVPLIIAVVIVGFIYFVKWSNKERQIQEAKSLRNKE